jgi:hypothetical protein
MQTLTLSQLRATTDAGGISGVTVKAQGGRFFVQILTRKGDAVLSKTRSAEPRCFANPFQAINLLRNIGIMSGAYDVSQYSPHQKEITRTRPDRAEAMKRTHEAASHDAWFREQVAASVDDPAPSVDDEDARQMFARRRKALAKKAAK